MNDYAFRLRFFWPFQQSVTKVCTQDDKDKVYHHNVCTTDHNHTWWIPTGKCIAFGAHNVDQPEYDLCHYHQVGETVYYWQQINNLDVIEYQNISYWHYLQSQKTTDFINGNKVSTETEYFYNSPSHYQLTSKKTTLPDKSLQETTYSYAHEKGKTDMIAANMVGIPLETEVKKYRDSLDVNPKIISKTGLDYKKRIIGGKELILQDFAYGYYLQNPTDSTKEVKYNEYDTKGNLLQYTLKPDINGNGGIPVTIIWGYNQTQPIAKIEGATYAQVSSLATALVTSSNADIDATTEQNFIAALDTFRKDSTMSGYQITTYTYDPLIGVTTITPPSGIREYYIYDTANRLQSAKDINGKILKEYQYNYKP
jgi:hypothetical protein